MLKSIQLANFKAFAELPALEIAPITVLCGANSSGKSSLLQSILLWKQTLESRNVDQTLLLNGRLVHLGAFGNLVYGKNAPRGVTLRCNLQFTQAQLRQLTYRTTGLPAYYLLPDLFSYGEGPRPPVESVYNVTYGVTLRAEQPTLDAAAGSPVRITEADLATWIDGPDASRRPGVTVNLTHQAGELYQLSWENVAPGRGAPQSPSSGTADRVVVRSANLIPRHVTSPDREREGTLSAVFTTFYRAAALLTAAFGSLSYVGPLRDEPARRYIYEDEVLEIGVKGENAPYLYLAQGARELRNHWFLDPAADWFVQEPQCTLKEATERWLEVIGVIGFGVAQTNEIIRLLADSGCREAPKVNIADVGFGVSQIFPIILEGLRLPIGHTLILEQPEIHLHPELQMRLADYLVCLALAGKKVIVETHSDHLINRFVRRIVEDEENGLADLARLYFVTRENGKSVVEQVQVDSQHGITNWPTGFFDQTATEQERIIQAGLRRRRKAREAGSA